MNEFFLNHRTKREIRTRAFSHSQRRSILTPTLRRVISALLLGGVCLCLVFFLIRVRIVDCEFEGQECSDSEIQAVQESNNGWMFASLPSTIQGKKMEVTRAFPGVLRVRLTRQDVLVTVFAGREGNVGVRVRVDGSGERISSDSALTASQSGSIIDSTILTTTENAGRVSSERLAVYDALSDFGQKMVVKQITIQSAEYIEIETSRELTAIVSSTGLADQLRSLQSILSSPTIEEKPARVDMRFNRPILQYL